MAAACDWREKRHYRRIAFSDCFKCFDWKFDPNSSTEETDFVSCVKCRPNFSRPPLKQSLMIKRSAVMHKVLLMKCFKWDASYEMPLMRCLQKDETSLLKADPPVTQSTLFWLKRTNEMRLKRRHFEEPTSMLQDRGNKANCRSAEFIHLPQMEIGFYVLDHKVSLRTLIRWWSKFDQTIR